MKKLFTTLFVVGLLSACCGSANAATIEVADCEVDVCWNGSATGETANFDAAGIATTVGETATLYESFKDDTPYENGLTFDVSASDYLYIKDGANDPYWYIFDVSSYTDTVTLTGDWFNSDGDAISHVAGYSTSPVPVPAAIWLFGAGLIGLVGVGRRKS